MIGNRTASTISITTKIAKRGRCLPIERIEAVTLPTLSHGRSEFAELCDEIINRTAPLMEQVVDEAPRLARADAGEVAEGLDEAINDIVWHKS